VNQEEGARRNVFISFAHEDLGEVNLLRGQAKNENMPLEFNDWSVSEPFNSERAPYIKQKIADRIAQASVTVVYLSDFASKSRWVAWEVAESIRRGKHVVCVYKGDRAPAQTPSWVKDFGLKSVPWSRLAETITTLP
jgi:hypothetical protein